MYYLCSDRSIYYFNAVDTIKNNKYSGSDSSYWFQIGSDVSVVNVILDYRYDFTKLFYDSNSKILTFIYFMQYNSLFDWDNYLLIQRFSLSPSKKKLNEIKSLQPYLDTKLISSNLKFIESAGIVHGKGSTNYFAFLINPLTEISFGDKIENLETTLFIADANNNIVFFTDNN